MGVQKEIEAVLLNSEGEPEQEIQKAFFALVKFAMMECEMTREGLRDMLDEAIEHIKEEEDVE